MMVRMMASAGACVVASMFWCVNVHAQSDEAKDFPGEQVEIHAVGVDMRGAAGQGAVARTAMSWASAGPGQVDFDILAGPVDLGRGAVKGAPYSADVVNEVAQVLADGNRIVRSSTTTIHRDGAGRTRREQGLAVIGPLVGGPDVMKQVVITDPEQGVTFVLNADARTARRMKVPEFDVAMLASPGGATMPMPATPLPLMPMPLPPPTGDVVFFEAAVPPPSPGMAVTRMFTARRGGAAPDERTESLGTQTVEGVVAEGTRSTVTIAAGQIGNERPIEVVSERWFSPEIKALVLSRQSDPRFGETTYRLSNIVLGEPSPSLFDVPSDFTIVEASGAGDMIFRRQTR
jgi:hypothetical protein